MRKKMPTRLLDCIFLHCFFTTFCVKLMTKPNIPINFISMNSVIKSVLASFIQ